MNPYYDEGGITIYHGDCREVLPTLTADVVLTDTPYGIGLEYDGYDDSAANLDALIATTLPMMRSAAPVVALTCGVVNQWRFPQPTWVLGWFITGAQTMATGFWGFNMWQPVLCYGTDPYLKRGLGRRPDVIKADVQFSIGGHNDPPSDHPCPKPLPPWRALVVRCTPDANDVVLDPMMGSGTTLRAAKDLGRRAIGIEISERYCEIAARRLGQEVLAFNDPPTQDAAK